MRLLTTLLVAALFGTVAPAAAPHASAATASDPYVYTTRARYGTHPSQWIEVNRLMPASGRKPTVYFVHGGSWVTGRPAMWSAEAKEWADRGWNTVNVSYRLGVDGKLMLQDLITVTSLMEKKSYVDPKRQIVVGDSAGGQLAALLTARYPGHFRGTVVWSPVASPLNAYRDGLASAAPDSRTLSASALKVWGSSWRTATPMTYVNRKTPPLWVAASTSEWVSYARQGALLCATLGSRCSPHLVAGDEHGNQLAAASPLLRDQAISWAEAQISRR